MELINKSITGTWKLKAFQIKRSDGSVIFPFGKDAIGYMMYTPSGHFSAQLMRRDRPHFTSGDQMKGTQEEQELNYKGVISYFGHYTFHPEEHRVIHHVEGSLFPNWEDQELTRLVAFTDNEIVVTTPPTLWGGGGAVVGELVWEKMPEPTYEQH